MFLSNILNHDTLPSGEDMAYDVWSSYESTQFPINLDFGTQQLGLIPGLEINNLDQDALDQVQNGVEQWADNLRTQGYDTISSPSGTDDSLFVYQPTEGVAGAHAEVYESDTDVTMTGDMVLDGVPSQHAPYSIMADDDVTICYGTIHAREVKLIKQDMTALDTLLVSLSGRHQVQFQTFKLATESPYSVSFPEGTKLGTFRHDVAEALRLLLERGPQVEVEVIGFIDPIRDQIQRSTKPDEAIVRLSINVYGPKRLATEIGGILSEKKFWLQKPEYFKKDITYDNPHLISFPGLEEEDIVETGQRDLPTSSSKARGEKLDEMVSDVHSRLNRANDLDRTVGDQRLATDLLEHQQSALSYMLQREEGNIPEQFRLWKKGVYSGQEVYIHSITKHRSNTRPDERGGGVLADEMGMGKTLSSLALLIHTLEDGKRWEEKQNTERHQHSTTERHSHSTLIIVPSALLIGNWKNEIQLHLGEAVKVETYHGRSRQRDIAILGGSDVVITTYNTLSTEHAAKKSVLHRINWYRIILDEAHIIRRQSTVFYRACSELEARSRWCLTGTPIQNKIEDIGALFAFLRAKPFDRISQFRRYISLPFEHGQAVATSRLVLLYDSLCLRRTKNILHLPGQHEHLRELRLSDEEQCQYDRTVNILNRYMRTQVGHDAHTNETVQLHHTNQAWSKAQNMKFGLFQAHMQLRIFCNHGTFQKYFSWIRRDINDEREAMISEIGAGSDAICDGCEQPSPVLSLIHERNSFIQNCAHVICQECLEDSAHLPRVGGQLQCPLCHRLGRAFEGGAGQGPDGDVDVAMADAEGYDSLLRAAQGQKNAEYFNAHGLSTKMNCLIQDVKADLYGSKGIVFSCWTKTLDLIAYHFDKEKITYERIDGKSLQSRRQSIIDNFTTNDEIRILLMTTGTGAFGLNLTAASRIFIVEPQWNPSTENQAVARAIRLRQQKKVEVIRYFIKGTVEEEMRSQQVNKRRVAQIGFKSSESEPGPALEPEVIADSESDSL